MKNKEHYSKEDVDQLKRQEQQKGLSVHFHIHEYPEDFDLAKSIANANEYHTNVPPIAVTLFIVIVFIMAAIVCVNTLLWTI